MMDKKYLYFQPEYVSKFKCDGSKCAARCCKNWDIFIDKKSYEKYPPEIAKHMKFFSEQNGYSLTMTKEGSCPFLLENNLCELQSKYGEEYLSVICTTYPRYTYDFKKFFERSLDMTCPVAAEMILFQDAPMRFEQIEVPEKIHSNGGKIQMAPVHIKEEFVEYEFEIQIAMIMILQKRAFTIDQRLIVLGFFLDKLDEIYSERSGIAALTKLISIYESEKFWAEQAPPMLKAVTFDAEKFIGLMMKLFEILYGGAEAKLTKEGRRFMDKVTAVLEIKPDENNRISISEIAATYKMLAPARNNFLRKYSSFLENYLVSELFINCYPWRLAASISKNFAVFLVSYKIFELVMFSATQNGLTSKKDLLKIVNWFTTQSDHNKDFRQKILEHFKGEDDVLALLESLVEK